MSRRHLSRSYPGATLALCAVVAMAGSLCAPSPVRAQFPPNPSKKDTSAPSFRQQVEMWIRSGQTDRAIELLETRRDNSGLDSALARRLASLYRETGRYADLEKFVLDSHDGDLDGADSGELRMLAEARFHLNRPDEARAALDLILRRDPGDPSMLRMVASVLSQNDRVADAVELLQSARADAKEPTLFAQLLARLDTQLEKPVDAISEYARVVVGNPLNIALVRGQVLQLADRWPDRLDALVGAVQKVRDAYPDVAQLSLLTAELRLRQGGADEALTALRPYLADPSMAQELLRLALAGLAESRSHARGDESDEDAMRRLRFSASIARGLLDGGQLPRSLQPRAWDTLTRTLMALLENPAFERQDSATQLEVLDETQKAILSMQRDFAGNRLTASALLRLAGLYSGSLHRPKRAIEIYDHITDDPGATTENLQLARMGRAEAYVAMGDTATARRLFQDIGQDMSFVEGQGRAQYFLGQIDFMGGHFETAKDRLRAVAVESSRADFANDALDLAVLLAEQEMSGAESDSGLVRYGAMLFHRAVADSEAMRHDLSAVTRIEGTSALAARARLDLAQLERGAGRPEAALVQLRALEHDMPGSRYLPHAMEEEADLLEEEGDPVAALRIYEKLLLEHESYIHLDRVRDRVRKMEAAGEITAAEEELP
jgi:tetratricopeptide (TPR) repeat protein